MRGVITTRHLLTNAREIIDAFGLRAYVRCIAAVLLSKRHVTFLDVVMRLSRA